VGEEEFEIVGETVGEELRAKAVHEFTMRMFATKRNGNVAWKLASIIQSMEYSAFHCTL